VRPSLLIVVCWLFVFVTSSLAGPFGLEKGMTVKQLSKLTKLRKGQRPYIYLTNKVPKPHKDIAGYILFISPNDGLCGIRANGVTINTSSYGDELAKAFYEVEQALTKKYGESAIYDKLKDGSIWHGPNEWMMSLLQKERDLSAKWSIFEKKRGDYGFADNLYAITLQAYALDKNVGYYDIFYHFDNQEKCAETFKLMDNEGL